MKKLHSVSSSHLARSTAILNIGPLLISQGRHAEGCKVTEKVVLEAKSVCTSSGTSGSPEVQALYHAHGLRSLAFLCPFVTDAASVNENCKVVILAVCFFNMAVALQAGAMSLGPEDRWERLEQARSYCKCSLSLIDDDDILDPDESLIYIYLASCYNKAGLELEQWSDGATYWMEVLENSFMAFPPDTNSFIYRYLERALHWKHTVFFSNTALRIAP